VRKGRPDAADENFWPAQTGLDIGPFAAGPARDGFVRSHAVLRKLGVRVPEIVTMGFPDETPAGFALQRGLNSLAAAAAREPRIAPARNRLADELIGGDFPNAAWMRSFAEGNTLRALGEIGAS
jgi:hypothetical protein